MTEKLVVDRESIRKLAKLLEETGLTEIEYQVGDQRIHVVRSNISPSLSHPVSPLLPPIAVPPPSLEVSGVLAGAPQGEVISSPMVGLVYLSSEPGADPFVKVDDSVKKGDTLLIIEAMKVMNPIRAPRDGKVKEICVRDATPIEFGEPLIILE